MFRKRNTIPLPPAVSEASAGRLGCGVSLSCKGGVSGYRQDGGSKPPPYRDLFVSVIEVKLAVIVLNGASRQGVPRNERSRVLGVPRLSPPTDDERTNDVFS